MKTADATNVNHRIGSETLTFPMSGIVDVRTLKSNGVQEFGWKLVIDIDSPGYPFDAGWASADPRIAARRS